jgi:hypothetical protein
MLGVCVGVTIIAVGSLPSIAWAGIQSDQSQASQLAQQIAAQGATIQALVSRSDQAQGTESTDEARVAADRARLAANRRAESVAADRLRQVAVHAYVAQEGMAAHTAMLTMFSTATATSAMARSEYTDLVAASLSAAVDAYRADQQRTSEAAAADQEAASQAHAAVTALTADQQAAQAALVGDEATLSQVKGNLQALLAAAQQRAVEEAMAAQPRPLPPPPLPHHRRARLLSPRRQVLRWQVLRRQLRHRPTLRRRGRMPILFGPSPRCHPNASTRVSTTAVTAQSMPSATGSS